MKKCIMVGYEEEKLLALRMYAEQKGVSVEDELAQAVENLYQKIVPGKEDLLYKTLKVQIDREYYCQKADLRFLEDVNLKRPKSMSEFETLWYNGTSGRHTHYHSSRYHALNLHSVFQKGKKRPYGWRCFLQYNI